MEAWIILAGVLQGVLEWLPVSSSGQSSLYYMYVLGLDPGEAYRLGMASHLGTAIGAVLLVRREIMDALRGGPWLRVVLVPTMVAAPIGFTIINMITGMPGDYMNALIGAGLVATGMLLAKVGRHTRPVEPGNLTLGKLAVVGVLEGLAAIPGLSRSAVTVAGLLLAGLDPGRAVRASILLGIPVTGAAGLYEILRGGETSIDVVAVIVIVSMVAGLLSASAIIRIADMLSSRLPVFLIVFGLLILLLEAPLIFNSL